MAANKKALEHLPEGADLMALTYDQLIAWSKNVAEVTGAQPVDVNHIALELRCSGSRNSKFRIPVGCARQYGV